MNPSELPPIDWAVVLIALGVIFAATFILFPPSVGSHRGNGNGGWFFATLAISVVLAFIVAAVWGHLKY